MRGILFPHLPESSAVQFVLYDSMGKKSHGDHAILRRPYEHRANSHRTVPVTVAFVTEL